MGVAGRRMSDYEHFLPRSRKKVYLVCKLMFALLCFCVTTEFSVNKDLYKEPRKRILRDRRYALCRMPTPPSSFALAHSARTEIASKSAAIVPPGTTP